MRGFAEIFAASVLTDHLSVLEIGILLGDVPESSGGARAQELLGAVASGRLPTAGNERHLAALISRESLARYLVAYGRPTDRNGCAMSWAQNVVARAGFSTASLRAAAQAAEGASLRFSAQFGARFAAGVQSQGSRPFSAIAYGGGLITDHPYLGPMVIDIASSTFATPASVLYDHKDPIGVVEKASLSNQITIDGNLLAGVNAKAKEVSDMADAGLPWQLSVGVFPGKIEELSRGQSTKVNGQTFTGPVTVFRQNRIREVSVVPLGAATDTSMRLH
jgi:hypothetical protein